MSGYTGTQTSIYTKKLAAFHLKLLPAYFTRLEGLSGEAGDDESSSV